MWQPRGGGQNPVTACGVPAPVFSHLQQVAAASHLTSVQRRHLPESLPPSPQFLKLCLWARAAVFIDINGTLLDHLSNPEEPAPMRLRPNACLALSALASGGYALVAGPTMSDIEHGSFTRAQLPKVQGVLQNLLRVQTLASLLDFLVCPHEHAHDRAPACLRWKPSPGRLTRTALQHRLALRRLWVVGESLGDVKVDHRDAAPRAPRCW